MTHIEALELEVVPRHLLILGAGFVGMEFAQAMRRFGSEVTVLDRNDRVLHTEDEDISEGLEQLFADEGIRIIKGAQILEAQGLSGESVSLRYVQDGAENTIEGSHILASTGRTPNTSGIGLEEAGVELTPSGYIKVNDRMQTSVPNVWAVGDCAGSPQFTHIAFDDFRIVRENMAGRTRTSTGRQVPFCLFTDPEFARVGLTETEAKARNIPHRLVKIPITRVLRAHTYSESRGFFKAILDEASDQILGFSAFGPEVSDVLGTIQMAMIAGLPYTAVRDAILTHPTMVEGLGVLFSAVPPRNP
jgi:pyruvate/2-oxoglutarate dehydrogenase complex dihydrolipoamide dehydrogenase (E3) component